MGIDNLSGGYLENIPDGVELHNVDLSVDDNLDERLKGVDYVFHLAAYAAEGLSPFIRRFNYTNNLVATANVVNACIKNNVKRLVFTSSMAVYGDGIPPFSEEDQPNPIDPYGIAKFACESDIKVAGEQHGLDWCIIRPHNVYGRRQNIWDKYRNVLGIWMYQAIQEKPMSIFGDGSQTRAFTYVDDIMMPLVNAATLRQCSKQIINLGGKNEISIIEANHILGEVTGWDNVIFHEARHEVKHAHCTYKKSENLLYYRETVSLKEGLADMWAWAKRQPKRTQFIWSEYELDKGIYSFWK